MAVLESNEDDLILDIEDELVELNDEDTTLLLETELITDEDASSDEARDPVSETFSDTLRSEANDDSDFSTVLEMALALSSRISFSLLAPKLLDCVILFSETPADDFSTITSLEITGVCDSVRVISVLVVFSTRAILTIFETGHLRT